MIEHDASLSRLDTYFGDADSFNDPVWAQVNASYGLDVVTLEQVAASRVARMATCEAENPEYNLTTAGAAAGWGEATLFLIVMGNKTTGNASREFVEIFFRKFASFPCFSSFFFFFFFFHRRMISRISHE